MTISHSTVPPQYLWGVKNKLVMQSVSVSCEGAGTQTDKKKFSHLMVSSS